VKFRSSQSGYISGIRFYKGTANTGVHVAHLWTSSGTLRATATFTNETATGWQEVTFATPIAITANTTYVASYYAPNGGYALNGNFFTANVSAPPLTAVASAERRLPPRLERIPDIGVQRLERLGGRGLQDDALSVVT
jgi:Domain of unknown function (DUF4082)